MLPEVLLVFLTADHPSYLNMIQALAVRQNSGVNDLCTHRSSLVFYAVASILFAASPVGWLWYLVALVFAVGVTYTVCVRAIYCEAVSPNRQVGIYGYFQIVHYL